MQYEKIKDLAGDFPPRLTRLTFDRMIEILEAEKQKKKAGGDKP
jgi:hypothetical protein